MKTNLLAFRGLTHYWRTNLAVVIGVATAVAVLSGALLVGDSVRGSLRDLVLLRIGSTDHVVISTGFVREALAGAIDAHPDFGSTFNAVAPMVVAEGVVTMQIGDGRAGGVRVYGVDDRFWQFHGIGGLTGPQDRGAFVSPALAAELGTADGDTILVRVQRPRDVPIESIYGQKDDLGQTIRANVLATLPPESLGEFSLAAQQGEVSAVFLSLELLQDELEVAGRVNALLVSGGGASEANLLLEDIVRDEATLEDMGLAVRTLETEQAVILEADDGLIDNPVVDAAVTASFEVGIGPQPFFTYLANDIRIGERRIPYSLVTALEFFDIGLQETDLSDPPPIVLNQWAADDLSAEVGEPVTLEYFLWEDPGRLVTREMEFQLVAILPNDTGDPGMVPDYPGIAGSDSLTDWDPPFPIDLSRIREQDEEYWSDYRTTPKAFIPFLVGQRLWQSRYGAMTSIRLAVDPGGDPDIATVRDRYVAGLMANIDPLSSGLTVAATRAEGMESSRGAVNFGEYFVYFSFFLVVSALMLAALFFKLSIEQRVREVGLLRAVGFTPRAVRGLFMREGLWLAALGTATGIAGGIAYGYLIVAALGTWWVDAVGTRALTLHVSGFSIAAGAVGGIAAATICIRATLGQLTRIPERALLAGQLSTDSFGARRSRGTLFAGAGLGLAGAALLGASAGGMLPDAGGFFGAGAAMLGAALCFYVYRLGRPLRGAIAGNGWWPVARLGLRNVTYRPSRSVVSVGMIASATFILISVDAFRKTGIEDTGPGSGIGGYSVIVESLIPVVNDVDSAEGREALGLGAFQDLRVDTFRFRPGDDASCLNLYTPQNPRIIAPTNSFIEQGRFAFSDSLATTDGERENPWQLLRLRYDDGAIPVIADAHSIAYVLHKSLGEDIVIADGGREIRLRIVAALDDSIFQGEILMSEANFVDLFPGRQGYPYLLVESPDEVIPEVVESIEAALEDFGATATPAAARLAQFHRVENTYLSTFQALGGLGLLLGTVGLGAVLIRNAMERRKELALLRALGYRQSHFLAMTIAENALLLVSGLGAGTACALLAIAPALAERGGRLPGGLLLVLLCGVLAAGLITSLLATIAALGSPLLSALREE